MWRSVLDRRRQLRRDPTKSSRRARVGGLADDKSAHGLPARLRHSATYPRRLPVRRRLCGSRYRRRTATTAAEVPRGARQSASTSPPARIPRLSAGDTHRDASTSPPSSPAQPASADHRRRNSQPPLPLPPLLQFTSGRGASGPHQVPRRLHAAASLLPHRDDAIVGEGDERTDGPQHVGDAEDNHSLGGVPSSTSAAASSTQGSFRSQVGPPDPAGIRPPSNADVPARITTVAIRTAAVRPRLGTTSPVPVPHHTPRASRHLTARPPSHPRTHARENASDPLEKGRSAGEAVGRMVERIIRVNSRVSNDAAHHQVDGGDDAASRSRRWRRGGRLMKWLRHHPSSIGGASPHVRPIPLHANAKMVKGAMSATTREGVAMVRDIGALGRPDICASRPPAVLRPRPPPTASNPSSPPLRRKSCVDCKLVASTNKATHGFQLLLLAVAPSCNGSFRHSCSVGVLAELADDQKYRTSTPQLILRHRVRLLGGVGVRAEPGAN